MQPVIVHGVPRSGTRFFSKVLGDEFGIFVVRPSWAVYKYYSLLTYYGDLSDEKNLRNLLLDLSKEHQFRRYYQYDVDDIINRLRTPDYLSILDIIFSDYAASKNMKVWGLKFDNNLGTKKFNFLDNLFPGYKFIHIIRDGRDVNVSTSKVLQTGHYNAYTNAIFWKALMHNAVKYGLSIKDRYLQVKYEDLTTNPDHECKRIAEFLDIKNFKYKKINIRAKNFNKWKIEMRERDIRIYEGVAGKSLEEYGYEVSNSKDIQLNTIYVLYLNIEDFILKCLIYLKFFLSGGGVKQFIFIGRNRSSVISWKIKSFFKKKSG